MANKREYLDKLQAAVQELHKCGAIWRETVPLHKAFYGETVWKTEVEIFDLIGHPEAKRAYAWSDGDGSFGRRERFVAVLEVPPVDSALSAVRTQALKDYKSESRKFKEAMKQWPAPPPASN